MVLAALAVVPAQAQDDWIKTGTGLGVEKVRIAAADFKAATADAKNATLLGIFNDTLFSDLDNAGIFEMVSKSFYPLGAVGAPADVKFEAWANAPVNAAMLAFGNLGVSGTNVQVQGWLYDVKNAASPQVPVFDQPNAPAPSRVLSNPTATNGKLVFLVVDLTTTGWVKVLLPVRPNGSTGWVRAQDVVTTPDPYKIVVSLSGHTLTLLNKGKNVLQVPAGIGKGNTPTPGGKYYLAQLYKPPNPKGIYGPFAYALNGYSEVLPDFNGGDPIIGIHGTNQPELVGQDVSHGCIRVTNDVITQLANLLPLGSPVQIKK